MTPMQPVADSSCQVGALHLARAHRERGAHQRGDDENDDRKGDGDVDTATTARRASEGARDVPKVAIVMTRSAGATA